MDFEHDVMPERIGRRSDEGIFLERRSGNRDPNPEIDAGTIRQTRPIRLMNKQEGVAITGRHRAI